MMSGGDRKVIVIKKKKKGGHGGHHGGSWKVAYADFVTAMMAFFLVMWIVGLDQGSKDLVQGYFSNPVGFKKAYSGGQNPLSQGNSPQNIGIQRVALMARSYQAARFEDAADEIEQKLRDAGLNDSIRGEVEILVTDQGLRIELMESGGDDTFFDRSSAALKPRLREILTVIAGELRILPNDVVVEGHTDAMPFRGRGDYSNWELSSDRANAARRVLERGGLSGDRITAVYGLAARQLKLPDRPRDGRNRRISVLLPFDVSETESIPLLGPDDLSGALPDRTPAAGAQR